MIQVQDLSYIYDRNKNIVFPDFLVKTGAQCLLLGESGSGKTTLLHLLGGLLKSQKGKIVVNDKDITALSPAKLDTFRGQHIGFVFQKNHLIGALNVKKNLLMAPYLANLRQDDGRVEEVLRELGVEKSIDTNVQKLSHGQAQRVAIARAVLNRPSLILADEPTSALDDKNCEKVIDLLQKVAEHHGSTLLIATHDQRIKSKIQHQIIL